MTVHEALVALGVQENTLSHTEKAQLDQDGYLPLYNILTAAQRDAMNQRLAELLAEEGSEAGKEVHQEGGTDRLSNLVNKSSLFDVCFTHPRLLAGIAHVLQGDLKLSSLNFRAALPGHGLQGLHADWGSAVAPDAYQVCNSIWLLDDFTTENGATRVVPGSHRSGTLPHEVMAHPADSHPDEVILTAPAGTVVIFNSHTWHGGTQNRTDTPRRALHSYFTRRHHAQQLDQQKHVYPETLPRLSEAAKYILDLC
jgi:ectoine hydroxylase-related dioxygenase (phytanoyl-CoA dioxygenase family)